MNKQKFKSLLKFTTLSLFSAFFFWQCENEAVIIEANQSETYVKSMDASKALSEIIGNSVNQRNSNSIFNEIDFNKEAKRLTIENNIESYTFALQNKNISARDSNSVYTIDNLNINLNTDGTYTTHIFRYTPDMPWFNNPNNELKNYTGAIQLLDIDRQILDTFTLVNGEPSENDVSLNRTYSRSSSTCQIQIEEICTDLIHGDGSSFGFECQVTISYQCSGGGESSGNDGGTTSNGDGESSGGGGDGSGGGDIDTNPILGTCHETNTCEEEEDADPCDNLKQKLSNRNADIKPKLEELKTVADETVEHGVQFKKSNGVYSNSDIPLGNSFSVPIATGGDNYGGAHTHPSIFIGNMFSWGDVYVLANLYNNAVSDVRDEVIFMLIAKENSVSAQASVYSIVVTDIAALNASLSGDLFNIANISDEVTHSSSLKDKIEALVETNNYTFGGDNERVFLEQFSNHGIKLFKANEELTNWSELEYNESIGTVFENPCN